MSRSIASSPTKTHTTSRQKLGLSRAMSAFSNRKPTRGPVWRAVKQPLGTSNPRLFVGNRFNLDKDALSMEARCLLDGRFGPPLTIS